ncbi:MAG: ParA family protein [Acidimicrobiales bacterium]
MPRPSPNQARFEWDLTVKNGERIPAKSIFGRRLITAATIADIIPGSQHFPEDIGMQVISATALKGGVSKTTICHQLAAAFGLSGRRVLLIDNDAQGSLSCSILGTDAEQIPASETVAAIYSGRDPLPSDVIRPTGIAGVDLIPGSMAAASFNTPDPHLASIDDQSRLRSFLDEVRGEGAYDLVIIDNPPNLGQATWNSLIASDFSLTPCVPEQYGVSSLSPVLNVLHQIATGPNPSLVNLGVVLSMVQPRLSVHAAFEQTLRATHGELIFDARIPMAADIKEAIALGRPVTHHKPRGASAKAFKQLADEISVRIARHQSDSLVEVGSNGQA